MGSKHPIDRVLEVLGAIGAVRLFLAVVVFGFAYLVMGNTAGRIIGVVLIVGAAVWVSRALRTRDRPRKVGP